MTSESVNEAGRVLFLDIDGVVLSGEHLWSSRDPKLLPADKLALVKEVCERSGACVVVSSTWRHSDETADRLRYFGLPLHPNWRTPVNRDRVGSIIIGATRGTEIHRWLARNPVESYAIVDDDSDMLPEQMERFVKTQFQTGIEREHVEKLVSILAPKEIPHAD